MYKGDKKGSQEQLVVETFDKQSQTYYDRYFDDSSVAHSFTIRRKRVCDFLDGLKGGKVLDVGCGPGIMVDFFVKNKFEFFGVDISKEVITQCKKKYGHIDSAHFFIEKIENLGFPDSFFDLVIVMGVFEYINDDKIAVKEVSRVVKPGGIVIITLPNKLSPCRIWNRIVYRNITNIVKKIIGRNIGTTINHREYKEKKYFNLLKSYQLNVIDVVYYNFRLLFHPFDKLFPGLTVAISRRLECLYRGKLRWLGTGFIVKAKKL